MSVHRLRAQVDKNENHMVYYHVLGTPGESDRKVFEIPEQPVIDRSYSFFTDRRTCSFGADCCISDRMLHEFSVCVWFVRPCAV